MSYELRDQQDKRDAEYQRLKRDRVSIETQAANWIDLATSLHSDSPLQTDKDDIITLRYDMIATLKVTLGL